MVTVDIKGLIIERDVKSIMGIKRKWTTRVLEADRNTTRIGKYVNKV